MKKPAFTLAEIAVVAAVLSTVSVGTYQAVKRGKQAECLHNLKQIHQAVAMFAMDHGGFPSAKFFPSTAGDPRGIHTMLKSYGGAAEVFFCPSVPSELNTYGTNYIWNDAQNGRDAAGASSATWLMTEMTAVNAGIPSPHTAGYGILYADGHAAVGPRVSVGEAPAARPKEEPVRPKDEPAPVRERSLSKLLLQGPAEAGVGEKIRIAVNFLDADDQPIAPASGAVSVVSSDEKAAMEPARIQLTAETGVRVSLDVTFSRSGIQWVRVREEERGIDRRIEVSVRAAGFSRFRFRGLPAFFNAGEARRISIFAVDAQENRAALAGGGVLGDLSGTAAGREISFVNGAWEGDVVFTAAAPVNRLCVAAEGRASLSDSFEVRAGAPDRVLIDAPASVAAGTKADIALTVVDRHGNPCAGFEGSLRMEMPAGVRGEAPGTVSVAKDGGGRTSAVVTFFTAGVHKVRVAGERLSGEREIAVDPGPLEKFAVEPIGPQTAGQPFSVVVKAEDRWGNRVKGFSLKDRTGRIRYVQQDFSSGMWMETVEVTAAGTHRVELDDGYGHTGTSNPFEVKPSAPARFVVENLPPVATAGRRYSFTVSMRDAHGNAVAGRRGDVSAAFSGGGVECAFPAEIGFPLALTAVFARPGAYVLNVADRSAEALKLSFPVLVVPEE